MTPQPNQVQDLSDTNWYLNVSPDDLNLYFAETYLRVERTGPPSKYHPPQWVSICRFEMDEPHEEESDIDPEDLLRHCNVSYFDKNNQEHRPKLKNVNITFGFPEVGLYNFKDSVLLYQRGTQRQNKKGLCSGNTDFFNTLALVRGFIELPDSFYYSNQIRWSTPFLNYLFDAADLPDFPEAFRRVKRFHNFSRAFSRDFFLTPGIASSDPALWFRKTLIGKAVSPSKVVIGHSAFLEEARDYFVPKGVSIDVDAS